MNSLLSVINNPQHQSMDLLTQDWWSVVNDEYNFTLSTNKIKEAQDRVYQQQLAKYKEIGLDPTPLNDIMKLNVLEMNDLLDYKAEVGKAQSAGDYNRTFLQKLEDSKLDKRLNSLNMLEQYSIDNKGIFNVESFYRAMQKDIKPDYGLLENRVDYLKKNHHIKYLLGTLAQPFLDVSNLPFLIADSIGGKNLALKGGTKAWAKSTAQFAGWSAGISAVMGIKDMSNLKQNRKILDNPMSDAEYYQSIAEYGVVGGALSFGISALGRGVVKLWKHNPLTANTKPDFVKNVANKLKTVNPIKPTVESIKNIFKKEPPNVKYTVSSVAPHHPGEEALIEAINKGASKQSLLNVYPSAKATIEKLFKDKSITTPTKKQTINPPTTKLNELIRDGATKKDLLKSFPQSKKIIEELFEYNKKTIDLIQKDIAPTQKDAFLRTGTNHEIPTNLLDKTIKQKQTAFNNDGKNQAIMKDIPTDKYYDLEANGIAKTLDAKEVKDILVDAKMFQSKSYIGEEGLTGALEGKEEFIPSLSQSPVLVYENKEGKRFIVDGHQRLDLFKRSLKKNPKAKLKSIIFKEEDGLSPPDLKIVGAIRNIDTADARDLAIIYKTAVNTNNTNFLHQLNNLAKDSTVAMDAKNISKLDNKIINYSKIETVNLNPKYLATIYDITKSPIKQKAIIKETANKKFVGIADFVETAKKINKKLDEKIVTPSLFNEELDISSLATKSKIITMAKNLANRNKTAKNPNTEVLKKLDEIIKADKKLKKQPSYNKISPEILKEQMESGYLNETAMSLAKSVDNGDMTITEGANRLLNSKTTKPKPPPPLKMAKRENIDEVNNLLDQTSKIKSKEARTVVKEGKEQIERAKQISSLIDCLKKGMK